MPVFLLWFYWFDLARGWFPSPFFLPAMKTSSPFDKYDEYRLHMEVLRSAPLTDFDIPVRILYPLGDAGIRRIRDLVAMTREQLLSLNRMGVVSVNYLENFLAYHKLSLSK